jgi:hypothetical protein
MGKLVDNSVLDAALNYIKNNAILLVVCSDTPTTYANATATYDLADVAIDDSDMTVADDGGAGGGRKVTIAEQATITVNHSGTATHVALCSADTLLYVTTCTSQALVAANTVTVPAWKIQIADPTA